MTKIFQRRLAWALFGALLALGAVSWASAPEHYPDLKKQAEALIEEGSFARAHALYEQARKLKLSPRETRWVTFRLADTLWRSEAATNNPDSSKIDQAQNSLTKLVRDVQHEKDRDRVWAEAKESLGDFFWLRRNRQNWGAAWPHYQQALDWWAGARDLELARTRYLRILHKIADPPWRDRFYRYGDYGNRIPLEILNNALTISQTPQDRARFHYLKALALVQQGGANRIAGIRKSFEEALRIGKDSDWYDDALFQYAEWLARSGEMIIQDNGQPRTRPDFAGALQYYRRILREFQKGETRYYEPARNQIRQITQPALNVFVRNFFLPDSEIQFQMEWRNVQRVDLSLHPVDLTRLRLSGNLASSNWLQHLETGSQAPALTWSEETGDTGEHRPGRRAVRLKQKLPLGAYVLEARAGGRTARELILVSNAALVLLSSGDKTVVYFADSADGAPLPGARVRLHERYHDGNRWIWRHEDARTNPEGLAEFKLRSRSRSDLLVTGRLENRQAFVSASSGHYPAPGETWKLYVNTDRPAYRPGETAYWKVSARRYDGSVYHTPAGETVAFEITDPRGTRLRAGELKLNEFGSAWDELPLGDSPALGEYQINFWTRGRERHLGGAPLFRLEEYKRPEFQVRVETPEEQGRRKVFLAGDTITAEIVAEYYFGGPVANANVEVLIFQNPYEPYWRPTPPYPWYYEETTRYRGYRGRGRQIRREVLKTDARGRARLSFDSPDTGRNLEYRIEARVTDPSRREVVATGTVRVARQEFFAYLHPEHHLAQPNDQVTVTLKTLDANNQPVAASGTVRVTRDFWFEIWVDPRGKEVHGQALERLRREATRWPPPAQPGWRLKFRGYRHDEILTRSVETNGQGEADIVFTPTREGYYRFTFLHKQTHRPPIRAETTVWVATHASTELGYRQGGVELIVDKDTFHTGQSAPVMISVPTNNRWVLFSVESDSLHEYRLVHVTGTVKLVTLDIREEHVPNIFLHARMVSDHQVFYDREEVIVPPEERFLTVDVQPDQDTYEPRQAGSWTITTRDHRGRPVAAEVSFALADESVFYIQQDLAPDPRRFFYGEKRRQRILTQSSFQMKRFAQLVEEEGYLIDSLQRRRRNFRGRFHDEDGVLEDEAGGLGYQPKAVLSKSARVEKSKFSESRMELAGTAAPMEGEGVDERRDGKDAGEGAGPAVQVRSDFRATVIWQPNLKTGKDGTARVTVTYPDSLTRWRATARALTRANRFGQGRGSSRTRKPLLVRLQAPRFFVAGDTVTLSANLNNNTKKPLSVQVELEAAGVELTGGKSGAPVRKITVPAEGQTRVDWTAVVRRAGPVKLRVIARGKKHADAMELDFTAHEHGIDQFLAQSGKMRGQAVTLKMNLPADRKPDSTRMTLQVTPSLAVSMLDALPYLIHFPYGCTEQTLSRFVPTVIVANTLRDLGLKREAVLGRVFGGIDPARAPRTHPKGKQDLRKLDRMIEAGLARLYDFQHSDGGWAWWKQGDSDPFMTAYVLWGLSLAQRAGVSLRAGVLERAFSYLAETLVEAETDYDLQAWELHALAVYRTLRKNPRLGRWERKAYDNLWKHRNRLNAYTRSLLALTAHALGDRSRRSILVRNLENGVIRDTAPDTSAVQRGKQSSRNTVMGTAHWGEDGLFYRWSEGGVEATAFALMALLAENPKHPLVEPVVNWLVKNRRGAHWSNTRDTAVVLMALTGYLKQSGELKGGQAYSLSVNGKLLAETRISDVLSAPARYAVDPGLLRDGPNEIRIQRTDGEGPLYFSAFAEFFNRTDPVPPAGNELFLRRQYYRLAGRPTLLKGYVYDKVPLKDGDTVISGERIETVLTIEAKNHLEYLVFEDLKPAGFEAVQIRSGQALYTRELKRAALKRRLGGVSGGKDSKERAAVGLAPIPVPAPGGEDYTGRRRQVYQELRDRKVALFVDKLPEGVWEIRYTLRAETPGRFHALPLLGRAMYIPEIRANGAEVRVRIEDADSKK